jgi:hypothetical protein
MSPYMPKADVPLYRTDSSQAQALEGCVSNHDLTLISGMEEILI